MPQRRTKVGRFARLKGGAAKARGGFQSEKQYYNQRARRKRRG